MRKVEFVLFVEWSLNRTSLFGARVHQSPFYSEMGHFSSLLHAEDVLTMSLSSKLSSATNSCFSHVVPCLRITVTVF